MVLIHSIHLTKFYSVFKLATFVSPLSLSISLVPSIMQLPHDHSILRFLHSLLCQNSLSSYRLFVLLLFIDILLEKFNLKNFFLCLQFFRYRKSCQVSFFLHLFRLFFFVSFHSRRDYLLILFCFFLFLLDRYKERS